MSERHLNILVKLIEISNAPLSSDDKLKRIVDLISKGLEVDICKLFVIDPGLKFISEKASNRRVTGAERRTYMLGSGIIGVCASTTQPVIIDDISRVSFSERALVDEADHYSSFAAFPVTDGRVYGVLYLSNEKPMGLNEETDIPFLQAVSRVAANIMREGRLSSKAEKVFREFSILYDISTAMMTTIKLDRLLHIILTAVTIGDGLGFNRAFLFLVNRRSNIIQGMMGVGPASLDEAWRAWDEYSQRGKGLLEIISSSLKENVPTSVLTEIVRSIRLSLDEPGIVARTVREQRPFNVTGLNDENIIHTELIEKLGLTAFASVPLMASGKVVGVIIVDNCFNNKPITDEDIRFLIMFANQAGLAIDNSLLYSDVNEANRELKDTHEKLLQSEKLAALGEMAANVAHEIRNPLTSLGGFARRLNKKLEGRSEKKYAEIMVKEVERLEKLLTDVLILSRKSEAPLKKQDINKILESTLHQLTDELKVRKIGLVKDFMVELPKIDCDSQQLRQVLINLLNNAIQAMDNEGVLTVATYMITEEDTPYVGVEVTDTGGGIPETSLPNIFNPFYTTKDTGTGLGLSISHRIVTHHHGTIEVINRPGYGATFIVKLPVRHKDHRE